ncbi:MAG: DNA/RNA non-specific endonuclease [Acidiferrobacterales bacterium]
MKSLIFAVIYLCSVSAAWSTGQDFCPEHTRYGLPSSGPTLLCRSGYALSYNSRRKVADWVAYHISRQKLSASKVRRSNDFRADADLPRDKRAQLSDYRGSGYDRGHMAPAAVMKWSHQAMSESFLLSNIAPQVGPGFNRGIWRVLEQRVRQWANHRGELYVITGPAYIGENPKTLGKNGVAIPSHFYKVVFDPVRIESIAFLLPNKRLSSRDLPLYITSIDNIEQTTGLDFLQKLSDPVEKIVESTVQNQLW